MEHYKEQGYCLYRNFFDESEIREIEPLLLYFHERWLQDKRQHYNSGLLNSHSLTSSEYWTVKEKEIIFRFIAQPKINIIRKASFSGHSVFLNTQLFFDPKNPDQQNYWHRDLQYTGMDVAQQQQVIQKQDVIHFRIPLRKENGIELIPESHRQWDTLTEYEVRNNLNGKKSSDALERGQVVALNRTDLLVFSANMIHRGLYGADRFTLDIIYCDPLPELKSFINLNDYPNTALMAQLGYPEVFQR